MMSFNPFQWTLRIKFLLISLFVLLLPLSAVVLLKEVEKILVENLTQNLQLSSRLISMQLESNSHWFEETELPESELFVAEELFVFSFDKPIVVDAFFDEWFQHEKFRRYFSVGSNQSRGEKLAPLLASHQNNFYLSLKVIDEKLVYAHAANGQISDQLVVSYLDSQKTPQRIFISPESAGEVWVKRYLDGQAIVDERYQAYWAETDDGFNVEIKFPYKVKPIELRISHFNANRPGKSRHENIISSSKIELNPLVWPSDKINHFIDKIELLSGQRLWILDTEGRVLARKGSLQNSFVTNHSVAEWFLDSQLITVPDQRDTRLRINSTVAYDALKGSESTAIESIGKDHYSIALAATPVKRNGQVIAAVFIEGSIARVQLLQQKNLINTLAVMLIIFILTLVLIVWYTSKVTNRINRLRKQVVQVVDEQGRMTGPLELEYTDGDEIDELSNAFLQMGNKLYDYNDYLEKLASRLSHELRTPIAIVRSSLDNLLLDVSEDNQKQTIQRALEGTQRLGEIINRMRQASGVKQAMQSAQFEEIDFYQMLSQMVDGFRQSFPDYHFEFKSNCQSIPWSISTDLMAELVDKLLSNAMDFSEPKTAIVVGVFKSENRLSLSVTNSGPVIPKKNLRRIFQSLISIRERPNSNSPNLGLGLYIVKLIANFHGANVKAENLSDKSGVRFSVNWHR